MIDQIEIERIRKEMDIEPSHRSKPIKRIDPGVRKYNEEKVIYKPGGGPLKADR